MYANLSTLVVLIIWARFIYIRCGNKIVIVFHIVDEKEMSERTGPLRRKERELTYFS